MRVDRVVAYFAPGAGLGHLNRGLAICLGLRANGIDARLITNSPFSAGIAGLSGCPVVELPTARWAEMARAYADEIRPAMIVTDTFPYGLRDEWKERVPSRLAHVARRLLAPVVLRQGDFAGVMRAEPLAAAHVAALGDSAALPGPVRIAPGRLPTRVPEPLGRTGLTLVVHSGPKEEVEHLQGLAGPDAVTVSPWSGIDYYPATNLFADARRVFTGAGYNSMADGLWWPEKHVAVPFPRRHDDQAARLAGFFTSPIDGTLSAVEFLSTLL